MALTPELDWVLTKSSPPEEALNFLSPREREVIRLRFGSNQAGKEYTLQECGEKFRITKERIRQIEVKAISRLRSPYLPHRLREYSDYTSN